jgi:hypothetical protein
VRLSASGCSRQVLGDYRPCGRSALRDHRRPLAAWETRAPGRAVPPLAREPGTHRRGRPSASGDGPPEHPGPQPGGMMGVVRPGSDGCPITSGPSSCPNYSFGTPNLPPRRRRSRPRCSSWKRSGTRREPPDHLPQKIRARRLQGLLEPRVGNRHNVTCGHSRTQRPEPPATQGRAPSTACLRTLQANDGVCGVRARGVS